MTDQGSRESGMGSGDAVERLLRLAAPRETVGAARRDRVRAAVHDAWRESLQQRVRRRWLAIGLTAAAAAAVVAAVILRPSPAPPDTPVAVARLIATTGGADIVGSSGRTVASGETLTAGSAVLTPPGTVAMLALEGGGELRVNAGTSIHLLAPRHVAVDRGQIYVDSGSSAGRAPLTIRTPAGVVRDIGTRFDVLVQGENVRVRVRDGAVRLESARRADQAGAGQELSAESNGVVSIRTATTIGRDWDWILGVTRFTLEGATLRRFLNWVETEGGRQVEFGDARLEAAVGTTVLHGSIEGLTIEQALDAILPTCGLSHRLAGNRVVLVRLTEQPRR